MKRLLLLTLAICLSIGLEAVPVDNDMAARAVHGWAIRNAKPGWRDRFDSTAVTHTTTNGVKFHSVRIKSGGTVFTSADTECTPIIAYTSEDVDFEALPTNHPLRVLLNRDLSQRAAQLSSGGSRGGTRLTATTASNSSGSANAELWNEFLNTGASATKVVPSMLTKAEGINDDSWEPTDTRVSKLVQSKWSQSGHGENWYTPNTTNETAEYKNIPGDPKNIVCGCVATAMAQIMRYHQYPKESIDPVERSCTWGEGTTMETTMKLTTQGGIYDWDKMTLVFSEQMEEENMKAIGKLTSDAGISVWMSYNEGGKGESGAFTVDMPIAFTDVWKYKSAYVFSDRTEYNDSMTVDGSRRIALKRMLFTNFDAGLPVSLSIKGGGGHQIVADGYGYESGTEYVHLNLGWAGSYDAWYNLPDVSECGYNMVNAVVYNIIPTGVDDDMAVVSGRILDINNDPVSNAVVTVFDNDVAVATTTSSVHGVWGVAVAASKNLSLKAVSEDGLTVAETPEDTAIIAKTPTPQQTKYTNIGHYTYEVLYSADQDTFAEAVGNSWGNDLVLTQAVAQIVIKEESVNITNLYATLSKAIAEASGFENPTIELLSDVNLDDGLTANSSFTLSSAGDSACKITFSGGAYLDVAANYTCTLTNVQLIATDGSAAVRAEANGCIVLQKGTLVDMVSVEDATGLKIEAVPEGLKVDCENALKRDQTFAYALPEIANVSTIRNVNEQYVGEYCGAAKDPEEGWCELYWQLVAPDPDDAVATVKIEGGQDQYYATLDHAVENFTQGELVVSKSTSLSVPISISGDATIRGKTGVAITNVADVAQIEIINGCLTVTNLIVANHNTRGLLLVNGEAAELVIEAGTVLSNLTGYALGAGMPGAGAVNVMQGKATIRGNAIIDNCRTIAEYNDAKEGFGGGVFLKGKGCELLLDGCVITNCSCQTYGGGVYVGKGAKLALQGNTYVMGNYRIDSSHGNPADNVYLVDATESVGNFTLTGKLDGSVGVTWGESGTKGRSVNDSFITVATDAESASASLASFSNDVDSELAVALVGANLVWSNGENLIPLPIGFSNIAYDSENKKVTATLTNVVCGCWYSIFVTNNLSEGFSIIGVTPREKFQAVQDGDTNLSYTVETTTQNIFLRATASGSEAE